VDEVKYSVTKNELNAADEVASSNDLSVTLVLLDTVAVVVILIVNSTQDALAEIAEPPVVVRPVMPVMAALSYTVPITVVPIAALLAL
jgi:hypothetical protein